MKQDNYFADLAARARRGDANADALFKSEMLPQLERIVRRALGGGGRGRNAMARMAVAQARRITSDPRQPKFDMPGHLHSQVASRLAEDVVANNAALGKVARRFGQNLSARF